MSSVRDQCDRHPSARAMTAWYSTKIRGILTLCAHCANLHDLELMAQDFELSIDDREALVTNRLQGAL
jgi:hypothetical protein